MFPADPLWFRLLAGTLIGMALGSFATMLGYRVPRGLSIVTPRSHCTSCNTTLGLRDLVPIFSYLAARGRCRHCGAKIAALYVCIEIAVTTACATIAAAL